MAQAFTYMDPSGEYDVSRQFIFDKECLRLTIRSRKYRSIAVSKDMPIDQIRSASFPDLLIRDEVMAMVPMLRDGVTEAMVYEAMGASGEA